jgi:hypothetical protein
MRVLPPVEEEIRRIVRDARAKDPLIRVAGLKAALEDHFGRGFSHQYVSKIADKVAREGLMEADRTKIEDRLQTTRENYRLMRERLLEIIYWKTPETLEDLRTFKPPLNKDVIEAAKNLVMMDLAILQVEIASGMYKKPVEIMAREFRYDPLPDEVRTVIIASWKRGGLLPAAVVEQMVPAAQDVPSQLSGAQTEPHHG